MQITRIKLCRFASGLLQTELAKQTNIGCRRLSEIENGESRPAVDELDRLATALGVSADQLIESVVPPEVVSPFRRLQAFAYR